MHYVVGDIHGCKNEFFEMIRRILEKDKDAQFILIGDIIDRGELSLDMLEWAIENVNKPNSIYAMILGNHEFEKNCYLKRYFSMKQDKLVNTIGDLFSDGYNFQSLLIQKEKTDDDLVRYIDFFSNLPITYELDVQLENRKQHYLIIHGGLPSSACLLETEFLTKDEHMRKGLFTVSPNQSSRIVSKKISACVWERNAYEQCCHLKKTIVIHGHTPTIEDAFENKSVKGCCGQIFYAQNEINIDCGAVFKKYKKHNLAVFCLETMEEFYLLPIDTNSKYYQIQQTTKQNMRDMSRKEFGQWYDKNRKQLPFPPFFF